MRQIGFIGLGKMGANMVLKLKEKGWRVFTFDVSRKGNTQSLEELAKSLATPRLIWLMVPAGKPVDDVLEELVPYLSRGDVVIDGGNSFYEHSIQRARRLARKGIHFLDVGVSGGPEGARNGACLMIGGKTPIYEQLIPLFEDLARGKDSFGYLGKSGAGHFVKMVHNGIETGMMQALAEGFTLMKRAPFDFNLRAIAQIYNNGSVIQSRLTGWLEKGFQKFGEDLKDVSGEVQHTGMSQWTWETAKKLGVSVPVIERSFKFRVESHKHPSYTGKILMMLRHMFGSHPLK